MTHGVAWPIAYDSFVIGVLLINWVTYVAIKLSENRKLKNRAKVFSG